MVQSKNWQKIETIEKMNHGQEEGTVCPSFNIYSADRFGETAARVAAEKQDDGDFEFSLVQEDEELIYGGWIGPIFPLFNRERDLVPIIESKELESTAVVPLSKLFIEEDNDRDQIPSCSSSDVDELESIPEGTYCVWRPKMAKSPLPSQCKKSNSTGSTPKRWKIRDLMRRSSMDGISGSLLFLTPKQREERTAKLFVGALGKGSAAVSVSGSPSAHETLYVYNRALKEEAKKKSYLPYRQDLVGFFGHANRSLPPF